MFSKSKILLLIVLSFSLSGCLTSSKNVNVYTRNDVNTEKSKVIIFPMLVAKKSGMEAANSKYSNPLVDAFLGKQWSSALGSENTVIIPKIALDKIPKAYTVMEAFIKALDTASALERNKAVKKFAKVISKKFGDGAFALALAFQDKKAFEAGGVLRVHMGLFDTKKLTWKWITKNSYAKSLVPLPYETVLQDLVSQSYEALKAKNAGKVR